MANVSVIMPARNAARTISASVASVLDQEALSELVVVDDGSTDNTRGVLDSISDSRLRIIEGPEQGIAAALNSGVNSASGAFIARCDADDLFTHGRLVMQSQWLARHPDFVAITGGFISMDAEGNDLAVLACDGPEREVTENLQSGHSHSSLCAWLFRRDAFLSIGGARSWFETAEDIDVQYRLAFEGRVWHHPVPVYRYRLHDASITHTRRSARLVFFDQAARNFALERKATGTDALERNAPPCLPAFEETKKEDGKLQSQVIGHLTAQAWRDFESGLKWQGFQRLLLTVRKAPFSVRPWRQLGIMGLKSAVRVFQKR